VRIAVVGKGGAGKSVIAGTMARLLARRGHKVLALDSDLMPGLAVSLGASAPAEPPLNQAAERPEGARWRLKKGIGPVRAVQRYSTEAPDGIRLLQIGKLSPDGLAPIVASAQAFYLVIHGLERSEWLADWTIVGDLPAGPRQTAFDWAPYASALVVVVEPTWKSALTARRIARIARSRKSVEARFVGNKVNGDADVRRLKDLLGEPLLRVIPRDEAVAEADRLGRALIDHAPDSAAVQAIERLVDDLGG
jgi:CO dehydrogenase maturation factor